MSSDFERPAPTQEEVHLARTSDIKRKAIFFVVCLAGMLIAKYVFGL
ncbi:MAG: hypothetical protein ACOX2I_00280 [Candidatus Ozemobacteraceae bacterium]